MNWGLFFGSLIIVYLVSWTVGYNKGFDDSEKLMREEMARFKKFEKGEDTE